MKQLKLLENNINYDSIIKLTFLNSDEYIINIFTIKKYLDINKCISINK